jgi:hypothetical protein
MIIIYSLFDWFKHNNIIISRAYKDQHHSLVLKYQPSHNLIKYNSNNKCQYNNLITNHSNITNLNFLCHNTNNMDIYHHNKVI